MVGNDGIITTVDQNAIEQLAEFLPDKIFDAHMHICDRNLSDIEYGPGSSFSLCGDPLLTMDQYIAQQGRLYGPDRKLRGNMVLTADPRMEDPTLRAKCAAFVAGELERFPGNVAEVPVLAYDTRADIEATLVHERIRGFKCYHWTAKMDNTWQCTIGEYLPEAAWEIANERGYCITLHMVRDHALSDEENLRYICEHAEKYPNAKLILAHAARGFATWTVMEAVEQVAKYPNIYFDFSAVCDPVPFMTIIKACGHKRVFWGSDFPVSMTRGTCVSLGTTFLWLYKEQLEACASNTAFNAYLIGIESLMAVRTACKLLGLGKQEVEDIFYNNAMELFGLSD